MSSKTSRKVPTRSKVEPIVTRTKSAQQRRQLKNKEKKIEKPELTKQQIKSTNLKTDKCPKKTLPEPIKIPDDVIEQVEYYPDKLKRDVAAKKIRYKVTYTLVNCIAFTFKVSKDSSNSVIQSRANRAGDGAHHGGV
ncbi:unnamed protein product [Spodoptera littoralis]|uniref:Uncharacterized protein n=1 Tax=Spodoptera littoralis TaxID=7109 RepID=A0A9P0I9I3_SPOLI|nr:unnamed protein product [Spodoptera littoralis]CAH1642698.1 unnamed protein product [Spodoptera littoralis]